MKLNSTNGVSLNIIRLTGQSLTSSAADFGHTAMFNWGGNTAGACAQGIWKFFTTKWLITASTPAKRSIPCRIKRTKIKLRSRFYVLNNTMNFLFYKQLKVKQHNQQANNGRK